MIDTHCHIDDPCYRQDLDAVIRRQKDGGVEMILVPGVNLESCKTVPEVCCKYPCYLRPALGLHPEDVAADWQDVLGQIRETVFHYSELFPESSSLVAIGEIGLDYHFSTEFKQEQQEVFRMQLEWAIELNLPVMIHSRDATEDTLRIIREYHGKSGGKLLGVMHCYSGSREIAMEYVKMGWKIGIGGVVTFKNSKLGETLKGVPLESLVLETDAPYMAPVPHRGETNESRWMLYVAEKLSEVYGVAKNDVFESTNCAAKALFLRK
ncbi:MAG: TatD family hydrolase [Paludibacteraceae bacterium]|nr:TatD family hydrolase [Paludibacteraceae bacterium]